MPTGSSSSATPTTSRAGCAGSARRSGGGPRSTIPRRGVTVVADDEGGPTVTHLHDPAGRLVGVVDDHGARVTKVYDRWGNPAATADRTGAVVSQVWDERGRLLRREEPDGAVTAFEWDEQDRIVARTDACGAVVRPELPRATIASPRRSSMPWARSPGSTWSAARWSAVTDPDGVVTRFERNGDGLITAVIDGLGERTVFGYDDHGAARCTGSTRKAGRCGSTGTRAIVSSAGWTPTAPGRLRVDRRPDGSRHRSPPPGRGRSFVHGEHGEVETVEDAGAAVSRLEWDGLGRSGGDDQPGRHDRAAPLRRARPAGVLDRRVWRRAPADVRRRGSGGRAGRRRGRGGAPRVRRGLAARRGDRRGRRDRPGSSTTGAAGSSRSPTRRVGRRRRSATRPVGSSP